MLSSLHVRNYVLIDSLDISFPGGLVIITGQTGAGKSILLGALSLVLGSRADASAIGENADNCVVEAVFDVKGDTQLERIVEENDLDWDGGRLVIRRVVSSSGRSRCFINDIPSTVQVLAQMAPRLVDIHSQHQTMLLSDHKFQMDILDSYAGNGDLLGRCSASWTACQTLRRELDALRRNVDEIRRNRDYNQAQYDQLAAAALKDPGELDELEQEQKRLANAEEIGSLLQAVSELHHTASDGAEYDLSLNLKEIQRKLERLSNFLPGMGALAGRVGECRIEIDDIMEEVSVAEASVDVSPDRLQAVEDRMSMMYSLMKKHGCSTLEELIGVRDRLSACLEDSSSLEERLSELQGRLDSACAAHLEVCRELHAARERAAGPFASAIEEAIRSLELPYSVFLVDLPDATPSADGCDSVLFRFSSTGKNPVDVAKCASGGEMSRIMLALKDMMARYKGMPTMIFDEIDTGVSGSVADKMGSMICRMGGHMQVFAITHLPQVAAKGNAHYVVSKSMESGRTVSTIEKLSAEQRVLELARMLSGSTLTPEAVANARALLQA